MKTCRQCATTWENGDYCPVCGMQHDILSAYSYPELPQPQTTQKKPISAGTILIAILVSITAFLMLLLYTGFKESQKRKQPSNNNHDTKSSAIASDYDSAEAQKNVLAMQQEKGIFPSGTYAVGKEIPAGEYVIVYSGSDGYGDFPISIYADASCTEESELYFTWAQNSHIVPLEEGQYIKFSHSTLYDPTKNTLPLDPFSQSGMYQVGNTIAPGTYTLVPSHDQYGGEYQIFSSINCIAPIVRESNYISYNSTTEITLQEGEYLKMTFCHLDPKNNTDSGES